MIKYVFKSLKRLGFGNYTGDLTEMRVGFFIERDGSVTGARILKQCLRKCRSGSPERKTEKLLLHVIRRG